MYRKSLQGEDRKKEEEKAIVRRSLANGTPLPRELADKASDLLKEMEYEESVKVSGGSKKRKRDGGQEEDEEESNAREVALALSFDEEAFESLEKGKASKKRKAQPLEGEVTGDAKKKKLAEVSGVDSVLLALQTKKNAARTIAKKAEGEEAELAAAGPFALKHKEAAAEKARKREFDEKLEKAGVDPERYARLHETQETVDAAEKRKNRHSTSDVSSLGTTIFIHLILIHIISSQNFWFNLILRLKTDNQTLSLSYLPYFIGPDVSQYASSFDRRSRDVVHDREAYEAQKEEMGEGFYEESGESGSSGAGFKPSAERMDAMVAELTKQSQKRKDFHRRRSFKEEKDITFINEANRKLNKQLDKYYGKATAAIKDSLERGTAL